NALAEADVVLVAPSNPVVNIGTLLAVPGFREALRNSPAPVVSLPPIIGRLPLRGMTDACLAAIGVSISAKAVTRHSGSRKQDSTGILDGWLVHTDDSATVPGVQVSSVPLLMSDVAATAEMAKAAFDLAEQAG